MCFSPFTPISYHGMYHGSKPRRTVHSASRYHGRLLRHSASSRPLYWAKHRTIPTQHQYEHSTIPTQQQYEMVVVKILVPGSYPSRTTETDPTFSVLLPGGFKINDLHPMEILKSHTQQTLQKQILLSKAPSHP